MRDIPPGFFDKLLAQWLRVDVPADSPTPMLVDSKQPDVSPASNASIWLHRRLVTVLATSHQRLRRRVMLSSLAIASVAGLAAFTFFWLGISGSGSMGPLGAAMLAVAVSVLTSAALYPALHLRECWLIRAASAISGENIDLLSLLGRLTELRSGEMAGHNLRVAIYTLLFGEALALPPEEIVRAAKGALLHDVGKLAISDRILGKPGPLTLEEGAEMAKHVRYGLEIVAQSKILQEAAPVVGAHHEHYDGKGYPLGLQGEAIPREARLFALVDVFDALTSSRVYKPAFSVGEALATMASNRGSHFDPILLDRFLTVAPDIARQLRDDETALTGLLLDRLTPYLDRLLLVALSADRAN